jgi:hypothetical protein
MASKGERLHLKTLISPDLNPIEAIWDKIKDYIEVYYPDLPGGRQRSYNQLRGIAQKAWDSITPDLLAEVVATMQDRCQAVIDAQGGHTKY